MINRQLRTVDASPVPLRRPSRPRRRLPIWVGFVILAGGLTSSVCSSSALAGNTQANKHYGQGVIAFYQGRYHDAIQQFNIASGYDNRDARVFLFRGLAKQRTGDSYGASADIQMGSQLEVGLKDERVGLALQRIQGSDRLMIERYRAEARKLPEQLVQSLVPPGPQRHSANSKQESPSVPPQRSLLPPPRTARRSTYRLSSLPTDATDPFEQDADGFLLGRGPLQPASDPSEQGDALAVGGDAPFGSGIAEDESQDDVSDQFMSQSSDDFGDEFGDDFSEPAEPARKKSSVFGAALKAFTRSVTPSVSMPQGIPGFGNANGADSGAGEIEAAEDDDLFGDDAMEDDFGFEDSADEAEPGDPFTDDDDDLF